MGIDIIDYLDYLGQERYRAVIIHTIPEKSTALTAFSLKLCEKASGKYLDLLDMFISDDNLNTQIDNFDPEEFRNLLIKESSSETLLVVDRVDFLLDTWRKMERKQFFRLMENQWDSFKENMKAKLIINMQTTQEIGSIKINDSQGESRIFKLSNFNEIL